MRLPDPKAALRFWFDPRGRVSRKGIWLGLALPFLAASIVADAAGLLLLEIGILLFFAWPLAVGVPWKRMHDMGRKGVWNVLFWVFYALGLAFLLPEYAAAEGGWSALFDGQPPVTTAQDLSTSALGGFSTILIFAPIQLAWLYLIPGQRGPNAYGPDPQAPSRE
jgi:uncharacterized membrane protein YhaH (DUF805 family)